MQSAGPLWLAALGALICSRAGVLFVGVEGTLLGSVFFSIAGTIWTGSLWAGVCLGALSGVAMALLCGMLAMELRMGDIIGGLVIQITALGVFAFLQQELFPDGQTIGEQRLEAPWPSFGGAVGEVLSIRTCFCTSRSWPPWASSCSCPPSGACACVPRASRSTRR